MTLAILLLVLPLIAHAASIVFWERALAIDAERPLNIVQGPDAAMWFTEGLTTKVGRITNDGRITEFDLPASFRHVSGIARGPDEALWITESFNHAIGRMTSDGHVTEFPLPPCHYPNGIVAGKNELWFRIYSSRKAIAPYPEGCPDREALGRITTSGSIKEFEIPAQGLTIDVDDTVWFSTHTAIGSVNSDGDPVIVPGSPPARARLAAVSFDKSLWFTDFDGSRIVRVTSSGKTIESKLPEGGRPSRTTLSENGDLWFTDADSNAIGRVTPDGTLDEIQLPNRNSYPADIAQGPDGAIWFTQYNGNRIGRVAGMMSASSPPWTLAGVTLGEVLRDVAKIHPHARRLPNAGGWLWIWNTPQGAVSAYTDRSGAVTSVEFTAKKGAGGTLDLPCTRGFNLEGSHVNLQFASHDCRIIGISTYELPDGSILDATFEGPGDGSLERAVWYRPSQTPSATP